MAKYEMMFEESFSPLYGDVFKIPAGTIIWRGFDPNYSSISDQPAYYIAMQQVDMQILQKGLSWGPFTQPNH